MAPANSHLRYFLLRLLPLILVSGLIALYMGFVFQHAINIPYEDDITDVLKFMSTVVVAPDWLDKAEIFITGYNDHRTGASRLIYYAAFLAQDEVSFRTLSVLANLGLPALLVVLAVYLRDYSYGWWILLAAALLMLQLRVHALVFFPMAAMAYFYVFLYGFVVLFCLHQVNRWRFMLAVLFAALGNFSLASGQLIWLLGLVSLLHQRYLFQRISMFYPLIWCALGAVVLLVFYQAPRQTPVDFDFLAGNMIDAPLSELIPHYIYFFFALLGSAVTADNVLLAGATGMLSLFVLAMLTCRNYREADVRLLLCWWYVVITVAAVSWGRAKVVPLDYALSSRYAFPSVMMLVTSCALLGVKLTARWPRAVYPLLILTLAYSALSYLVYSGPLEEKVNRRIMGYNRGFFLALGYTHKQSSGIVEEAKSLGIYNAPERPVPDRSFAIPRRDLDSSD